MAPVSSSGPDSQAQLTLGHQRLQQLLDAGLPAVDAEAEQRLIQVLSISDFAFDAGQRESDILIAAAQDPVATIEGELAAIQAPADQDWAEGQFEPALRQARRRVMLAIAVADLSGQVELAQVLAWLTEVADRCIQVAVQTLYGRLASRWGTPRSPAGDAQPLIVLGMGKLGGGELNFSSDIDLIFAYPEEGETDGRRSRSNAEFFRRLGQQLIRVLDEVTEDGFVFRVDMRLRPHGEAGALAHSFAALEQYYQREGRNWERYALIKARPIANEDDLGEQLLTSLRPFVYRKYLDFAAIDALREMKARVAREVRRRGLEDNIKLGPGGIREIEFLCQLFQLIRGGTEPSLRTRSLESALNAIEALQILPRETAGELRRAYRFLRILENRLQMLADQQTHDLPRDEDARQRLALAMGMADFAALLDVVHAHRGIVHDHFRAVFADQAEPADTPTQDLAAVWRDALSDEEAEALLRQAELPHPQTLLEQLRILQGGKALRTLSASGRERLGQLMPRLLADMAATRASTEACGRVLRLIEAIARRSAYVALLTENAGARRRLVRLCEQSAWIARQVSSHPILLDELLEQPRPAPASQLIEEVDRRLATAGQDDLEAEMDALRVLQRAQKLRIAVAELSGAIDAAQAAAALSALAETMLIKTLALARRDLVRRYGEPRVDGQVVPFGIVAYGRLGAAELGYESDLDLVFLHGDVSPQATTSGARSITCSSFFMRLSQRLIHHMQVLTSAGRLYEVDVRLRPDGGAGLLVSPLSAYADYQLQRAWTWERQSLVRARMLGGSEALQQGFAAARSRALARPPGPDLAQEVAAMRARMREQFGAREDDAKHAAGGLLDLDFCLQFLVLQYAHQHPLLLAACDTQSLLENLAAEELIQTHASKELLAAHRQLQKIQHRAVQTGRACDPEQIAKACASVRSFYNRLLDKPAGGLQ